MWLREIENRMYTNQVNYVQLLIKKIEGINKCMQIHCSTLFLAWSIQPMWIGAHIKLSVVKINCIGVYESVFRFASYPERL